jgi:hypothetical protein
LHFDRGFSNDRRKETVMMERFLCVVALLALGCGGAGMTSYTPAKEKTKFSEDDLFTATVRALEAKGYTAIPDREQLVVKTREKEISVSSVPKLSYKYTWQIQTKGGTLAINSTCQENSAMSRTEFEDCGDDRPQRMVDEQQSLVAEILDEAKKVTAPAPQ